jgi:hypothetical protein
VEKGIQTPFYVVLRIRLKSKTLFITESSIMLPSTLNSVLPFEIAVRDFGAFSEPRDTYLIEVLLEG